MFVSGAATATQAEAYALPMPSSVVVTLLAMIGTGLVTWGMFKKATERNEAEIDLLRTSLTDIHVVLGDVRERVARIEGKLDPHNP